MATAPVRAVTHLTSEEMREVAQVFTESFDLVLERTADETARNKISKFIAEVALAKKPYLMVTAAGLQWNIGEVFTDDSKRDFVFTLFYVFSSRWGMSEEKYCSLAANLARGACPVSIGNQLNGVPVAVSARLTSFEEAHDLLIANQWLVVLLMLQLFVRFDLQQQARKPK